MVPERVPRNAEPEPWAAPKPEPVIVTCVPAGPEIGKTLVIEGVVGTIKLTPLLVPEFPATVTIAVPGLSPLGTVAVMVPSLQLKTVAAIPLNLTELEPCVLPKFVPAMVTAAPTNPDAGQSEVMVGGATTVKLTALLAAEPTVTMTLPVVAPFGTVTAMLDALHPDPVKLAEVPLNLTVLLPWVAPKLLPEMTTVVPTDPELGDKDEIVGA